MPQYLSIAGLRLRHGTEFLAFGIVGDDPVPPDDIDVAAVGRAIADAEAEVDGYLGNRNELPLPNVEDIDDPESNPNVPEVLRRLVADIAIYRMSREHDRLTKEKRLRYEDAIKWLQQYAESKVSLGIEDAVPSSGGVYISTAVRRLSRADTDGLL